jgi:DNA-binding transcriptional LysR family regulator
MYPGDVELRLFRYVVAVADELHFSRAAEKLHVAQPALSRQIRDLEERLGTKLFDRTTRELHLTDAGLAFVAEARESLLHSDRAVHAAKSRQQHDRFTLGHSPGINPGLLSKLRSIPAQLWKLTFRSIFSMEQVELIRSGELDAGVVILPIADEASLEVEPVLSEPLMIAMPGSHRLRQKKALCLRDLNEVPLITIPRKLHPYFYDRVYSICVREGFEPKVEHEVTSFPEAMALVADGAGFAFTRECYDRFKCAGVVFKKIAEEPLWVESALVFRKGTHSSVLTSILAVLQMKKIPVSALAFRKTA